MKPVQLHHQSKYFNFIFLCFLHTLFLILLFSVQANAFISIQHFLPTHTKKYFLGLLSLIRKGQTEKKQSGLK